MKIYKQYDGEKETLYSKKEYSLDKAKDFFSFVKKTITDNGGSIIGESEEGFYAKSDDFTRPFTMYVKN